LVDAPASGAGARKGVEVRVLFWAPFFNLTTSHKGRQTGRNLPFIGFTHPGLCQAISGDLVPWGAIIGRNGPTKKARWHHGPKTSLPVLPGPVEEIRPWL
jgi:hypothetical protein